MLNIYEIPQEVEKALSRYYSCFDMETGELIASEELLAQCQNELDELQNRTDELVWWYLKDRANRIARSDAIKAEITRLQEQNAREEKAIDRIEMLIGRAFERVYQGKPMNIGTFTLSYRKSEAVVIESNDLLPSKFLVVPEPPAPRADKTAIKNALKAWEQIPGAKIEERQNLQIK